MLFRAGVSTSNGARMNLWHGLASRLPRQTFTTVEEVVPMPSEIIEELESRKPRRSRTAYETHFIRESKKRSYGAYNPNTGKTAFGPFPRYLHPACFSEFALHCSRLQHEKTIREPDLEPKDMPYWRDNNVEVLYAHLPQSSVHLVVQSLRCCVPSLPRLTREHLPHLKEMAAVAESIICSQLEDEDLLDVGFQYGFHAISSKENLPLHVLSRDFVAETDVVKDHWNAFNTEFFIPARTIISALERDGKTTLLPEQEYMSMLRQEMRCRRCNQQFESTLSVFEHVYECHAEPQPLE